MTIDTRLAVYGTLAPGRVNHDQLAPLDGRWRAGRVRGRIFAEGWGAAAGYPLILLDPAAPPAAIQLFESADLPRHWARLDAFEGEGYRRVAVRVETEAGTVDAWIYEAAEPRPEPPR